MLESMHQLLSEVRNSEEQKKKAAAKLRAEIETASARIDAGPGWTPDQEVNNANQICMSRVPKVEVVIDVIVR